MLRLLPMLLILGLALFALIDVLARDDDEIRGLPKIVWVFVVLLFPLLGSLAWFFAGRAGRTTTAGGQWRFSGGSAERPRTRPVAPDDDPDFLRRLGDKNRGDQNRRRPADGDDERERRTDG
jgi:hypothetical protein